MINFVMIPITHILFNVEQHRIAVFTYAYFFLVVLVTACQRHQACPGLTYGYIGFPIWSKAWESTSALSSLIFSSVDCSDGVLVSHPSGVACLRTKHFILIMSLGVFDFQLPYNIIRVMLCVLAQTGWVVTTHNRLKNERFLMCRRQNTESSGFILICFIER